MHQGEVWKGYVKASRRGMRMVRGMKLGHEEETEAVWQEGTISGRRESPLVFCTIHPDKEITPPIAPQYQVVTRDTETAREGATELVYEDLSLLSDEVRRIVIGNPIQSGFLFTGEGAFPPPSKYTLRELKEIIRLPSVPTMLPALTKTALATSTQDQHRHTLTQIRQLNPELDDMQLDLALIEGFSEMATQRGWKASTLVTRLACVAGVLRLLPLYAADCHPIILGQSIIWAQAQRGAQRRALPQFKKRAKPATWRDVESLLAKFGPSPPMIMIMIAYAACARMGDVARLRRSDITEVDGGLLLTFKVGKTTLKRGVYTVPAALPAAHARVVFSFVDSVKRGFMFKKDARRESALILKTVGLTNHSVRRGAILRLAASGMPATDIIRFSGHASVEGLISYLDDGINDPQILNALSVGAVLYGGGGGGYRNEGFPPTTEDILSTCAWPVPKDLPLHINREVRHMDLERLEALPMGEDCRSFLHEMLRWVRDPDMYNVTEDLLEKRFSPLDAHQLKEIIKAKCEEDTGGSGPRAEVFPFGVRELKKRQVGGETEWFYRIRPIFEPKVNDTISNVPKIQLCSLEENILGAHHFPKEEGEPEMRVQLDFVSYYDQIPLHQSVRRFFCLKDSRLYVLRSLPMGLRVSVAVACGVTWALLDFPMENVTVTSYVDNVRFVGARSGVIAAVLEFIKRCKSVGATCDNEPMDETSVIQLSETQGDFLGR